MRLHRPTATGRRLTSTRAFLLGALALALTTSAQQDDPPLEQQLNILYSDKDNVEVANEYLLYNTCHQSKIAPGDANSKYAYLGFVPIDASVNFYKDDNCQEFAFGLVGHYEEFPGPAKSIKWVGRDRDNIGIYFTSPLALTSKDGFGQGGGGGNNEKPPEPKDPTKITGPPVTQEPSTQKPPPIPQPPPPSTNHPQTSGGDNNDNSDNSDNNNNNDDKSQQPKENTFLNFVGSLVGSAVVLSIGGTIVWVTVGKKIKSNKSLDKGKGVLPYSRHDEDDYDDEDADGDEHIRLTTASRIRDHEDGFEIGGDDDVESSDDDNDSDSQYRRSSSPSRSAGDEISTRSYHDRDHSDDSKDTEPLN